MRLEHYIFLSLLMSAAMITGSTLGIAANFPYIAEQVQRIQGVQFAAPEVAQDLTEAEAVEPLAEAQPAAVSANSPGSPVSGSDVMLITAAEKKQIVEMLITLGMNTEADFSAFIKGFQQKHALNATGLLDSKTLFYIMEEVKLKQACTRQASL